MGKAAAATAKAQAKKKSVATDGGDGVGKKRSGDWDSSRISDRDISKLRKEGRIPKDKRKVVKPGAEVFPAPPPGYVVIFLAFLERGLSLPAHEFLRGFLFIHGVQLYQLTPNTILHLSFFITLCECFLGVAPHWGLWKKLYYVKRFPSSSSPYTIGGFAVCLRGGISFFNLEFKESIQGWRRKWFYVEDSKLAGQEFGIAPFSNSPLVKKRSWAYTCTATEEEEANTLLASVTKLVREKGKELSGTAVYSLFLKRRIQPLQARAHPMWMYSGASDPTRSCKEELSEEQLLDTARRLSKIAEGKDFVTEPAVQPFCKENPLPLVSIRKSHQVPNLCFPCL